ncbi:MAG: S8 family serine peptidase [bacterium]
MKIRNALVVVAGILLISFSACSSGQTVDPIRPNQVFNSTSEINTIDIIKAINNTIEIVLPEHKYPIELAWNHGLQVTNSGETIYDFTLTQNNNSYSAGIIETGMTTASLNIPLNTGSNKFTVSFSDKPWFVINDHIYHTDAHAPSHEVLPSEFVDGWVDNEILFGFIDGTPAAERHRIIREHNLFLVGINTGLGMHTGRFDDGRTPQQVIDELKTKPSVKWPTVNGMVSAMSFPNDYIWRDYVPDDYKWAMKRIEANRAWDVYSDGVENGIGDASVKNMVLVISDTGTHPHVDFGLDSFDMWASYKYSRSFVTTGGLPYDAYGHGTSCAGIAGAMGNNQIGMAGVAWDPYFLALKCLSDAGYGSYQDVGDSIAYIGDMAAEFPWLKFVANYSLGGWSPDSWNEQAARQTNAYPNTMLIGAAGNSGMDGVSYPAKYIDFHAVGASSIFQDGGLDKEVANECPNGWGTNWGLEVEVCAPGSMSVTTTNLPWNIMYDYDDPACPVDCPTWYCDHFGGTSAATPHVTGLCMLLWSKNPTWTKSQVMQKIKDTCDEMSIPGNKAGKLGAGRINAYRALTE